MQAGLQKLLEAEMREALDAAKGELTPERLGVGRGTPLGRWSPGSVSWSCAYRRTAPARFATELFARHQRNEKALVGALAEMHVEGVSMRKVKGIAEGAVRRQLLGCGDQRDHRTLAENLAQFAERRLTEAYPCLTVDARYEPVRAAGAVASKAVLLSTGTLGSKPEGQRRPVPGARGRARQPREPRELATSC